MKRSSVAISVATFALVMIGLGYLPPQEAHAEGHPDCVLTVGTTATDTQNMTDGGTRCPWGAKAVVAMQCKNAEVCYEPAQFDRLADGTQQQLLVMRLEADGGRGPTDGGTLADGGVVSTTSVRGPVATTSSFCVNFIPGAGSPDPYIINLGPSEKNIGLILASTADGGTSATCNFSMTRRQSP